MLCMPTLSSLLEKISKRSTEWILCIVALIAIATPITLAFINETKRERLSTGDIVGERIPLYEAIVSLTPEGGARVEETFTYDFKAHTRSGLTRLIPRSLMLGGYLSQDRGLALSTITRNGQTEPTSLNQIQGHTSIRIGAKNQSVTGTQHYQIPYQINRAVIRTNTADTVRLSPTDTSFGVPIDTAAVTVHGPIAPLQATCSVGPSPEKETTRCRAKIEGTSISFQPVRWLEKGEGLFISIDYPLGTFATPLFIRPTPIVPAWMILILIHLLLASCIWFIVGRDHPGRGVVIPSEELLKTIKPYEAGALLAQGPDYASFIGMIFDLVRRKAVKLERRESGGYITFNIVRLPGQPSLDAVEGPVLKRLLMYSTSTDPDEDEAGVATLDQHSGQTGLAFRLFESVVGERLVQRGWYQTNIFHTQILSVLIVTGWSYTLLALLESRLNDPHLAWFLWQIPLILPIVYFMPRLTKEGALAREQVRGLHRYIEVAEKDRLAFHEGPEHIRDEQNALLPYAIAMGIQKDWKKQFLVGYKEISKNTPT